MSRQHGETTTMKTLYIFLTRSGTLLSNLVYSLTGAQYTHISLAFDEDLSTLYSSTRKNGYTMFPAGPSREYLNRGVFLMRENIPCALYALEVTDEAYTRAKRRTQHMMHHGELYRFNSLGLLLCWMHIRWQRRRHYFCSQFVSAVRWSCQSPAPSCTQAITPSCPSCTASTAVRWPACPSARAWSWARWRASWAFT